MFTSTFFDIVASVSVPYKYKVDIQYSSFFETRVHAYMRRVQPDIEPKLLEIEGTE